MKMTKNNIPVGTYWYCYPLTPEVALQEAKVFLKKVKGKKFKFPNYYDFEEPSVLETGSENLKNIVNTFWGELEKNNYYCRVYSSLNAFWNKFPAEIYQKYAVRVAYLSQNRPQKRNLFGVYGKILLMEVWMSFKVRELTLIQLKLIMNLLLILGKNGYDNYSK